MIGLRWRGILVVVIAALLAGAALGWSASEARGEAAPGFPNVRAQPSQACVQALLDVAADELRRGGMPVQNAQVWTTLESYRYMTLGKLRVRGAATWQMGAEWFVAVSPELEKLLCWSGRQQERLVRRGLRWAVPEDAWCLMRILFHELMHQYSSDEGLVDAVARDQAMRYSRWWAPWRCMGDQHDAEVSWYRKLSAQVTGGGPWTGATAIFERRRMLMTTEGD